MIASEPVSPSDPLWSADASPRPPRWWKRRALWISVLMWTLIAVIGITALYKGTRLRHWFFDVTERVHFNSDNRRNYMWGYTTFYAMHDAGRSFLDTYDDVGIQQRGRDPYIDYAPGRLAVYTAWQAANHAWGKTYAKYESDRDFWAFFIDFNNVLEAIGAVGAFLLVRQVLRSGGRSPLYANGLGLAAALLLWFNPAMIVSAYGWPSGDMWIVPPFIWAVYLCRRNNWALAGAALAIGALLKGQQFFVLPMFILWPLIQLRWRAALALVGGFVALFGLATCGWTLTQVDAEHVRHKQWAAITFAVLLPLATVALAIARPRLLRLLPVENRRLRWAVLGSLIALPVLLASWPSMVWTIADATNTDGAISSRVIAWLLLIGFATTAALTVQFARRWQTLATIALGLFGAIALSSMLLFSTSFAWFDAGYLYGTDHWEVMVMGRTSNLPGIMAHRFGWDMQSGPHYVVHAFKYYTTNADGIRVEAAFEITLKTLLFSIYLLLLVLTSIGVALHDRRNSPRFLVAVVTPWVLFFTIPCQIHERYLLFAAGAACICVGHSVGMALLGVFMSLVTWIMTMHVMIGNGGLRRLWNIDLTQMHPDWFPKNHTFGHSLFRFINGTHPDIGWAVILTALVFLWISVTPGYRRRPDALPLEAAQPAALPPA